MTNIPNALRERLQGLPWGGARIHDRCSPKSTHRQNLFELDDGELVEGVLMRIARQYAVPFHTSRLPHGLRVLRSTLSGRVRNLSVGELIGQVAAIERDEAPTASGRAVQSSCSWAAANRSITTKTWWSF
jgi:adenine C2-methylase RlmN of 23S rRNA A2503 and tRNA A37